MATITSFNFDANTSSVTLNFDVAVSAIDTTKLYAVPSNSSTSTQYTLYGTVSGLGTTTITIALSAAAKYAIQSTWQFPPTSGNVWDDSTRCYLYVNDSTATTPTFSGTPFRTQVTTYTLNTTAPFFVAVNAALINTNATANTVSYNLACAFTSAMSSTVGFTGITIQDASSSPTVTYTLTGGTVFVANNIVYIKFNNTDWTAIKNLSGIFTSTANTFVKTTALAFQDVQGNPAFPSTIQATTVSTNAPTSGFQINVANEYIYGGTSGQFLTANGSEGVLSWSNSSTNRITSAGLTLNSTLIFNGSTSGSITINCPSTAGTQSYTLPTAVPTVNGQVLSATTSGVMSWITPSGGGSNTLYLDTNGTPTNLALAQANASIGATSITLTGDVVSAVKDGTIIGIPTDSTIYRASGATLSSGNTVLTITPALVVALTAGGQVTYQPITQNSFTDIVAGSNVTLTKLGNQVTISASGGGGSTGVSSLNGLTGALFLTAATNNVTITPSGTTVSIAVAGVTYYQGTAPTGSVATLPTSIVNSLIPAGTPLRNGDIFYDLSTRANNVNPVYLYINGNWGQVMMAFGGA